MAKGLKSISSKQTKTGLNRKFVDAKGNSFSRTELVQSKKFQNFYGIHTVKRNGTTFLRSNPDKKKNNNLE